MIKEYEPVMAVKDLNSEILQGCRGIVVMVYDSPPLGYEVEFVNDANETIAVLTVNPNDISSVSKPINDCKPAMNPVYIFTGLGADDRVFQDIDLPGFQKVFIQWVVPFSNESIENYSQRLTKQIKASKPILIGLSFGGIIAVEVAKFIETERIILIASAKTQLEIPFYYRLAGFLRLHKLVPTSFLLRSPVFSAWAFGAITKNDKENLANILNDTSPFFLKWAINEVVQWRNRTKHHNLVHIHGTADRILPYIFARPDITVLNGGHFMTVNRAPEITNIITSLLKGETATPPP